VLPRPDHRESGASILVRLALNFGQHQNAATALVLTEVQALRDRCARTRWMRCRDGRGERPTIRSGITVNV